MPVNEFRSTLYSSVLADANNGDCGCCEKGGVVAAVPKALLRLQLLSDWTSILSFNALTLPLMCCCKGLCGDFGGVADGKW